MPFICASEMCHPGYRVPAACVHVWHLSIYSCCYCRKACQTFVTLLLCGRGKAGLTYFRHGSNQVHYKYNSKCRQRKGKMCDL